MYLESFLFFLWSFFFGPFSLVLFLWSFFVGPISLVLLCWSFFFGPSSLVLFFSFGPKCGHNTTHTHLCVCVCVCACVFVHSHLVRTEDVVNNDTTRVYANTRVARLSTPERGPAKERKTSSCADDGGGVDWLLGVRVFYAIRL